MSIHFSKLEIFAAIFLASTPLFTFRNVHNLNICLFKDDTKDSEIALFWCFHLLGNCSVLKYLTPHVVTLSSVWAMLLLRPSLYLLFDLLNSFPWFLFGFLSKSSISLLNLSFMFCTDSLLSSNCLSIVCYVSLIVINSPPACNIQGRSPKLKSGLTHKCEALFTTP